MLSQCGRNRRNAKIRVSTLEGLHGSEGTPQGGSGRCRGGQGRRHASDRGAVDDQYRHCRRRFHRQSGDGAGARRPGAGAGHGEHRSGGGGCAEDRGCVRGVWRPVPIIGDFHYNGHLLLRKSRVRTRAGQIPDQSRQLGYRQEDGRQFPHHDRSGYRESQSQCALA